MHPQHNTCTPRQSKSQFVRIFLLSGGGDLEAGVVPLVVLDSLLRATTKKVVNILRRKVHRRQNAGYAYVVQICVEYFADRRLEMAYTSFLYVVVYLLPVVTMLATYGRIAVVLWRRRPIGDSPDTLRDSRRRLQVAITQTCSQHGLRATRPLTHR